jgi:hypothetical protein
MKPGQQTQMQPLRLYATWDAVAGFAQFNLGGTKSRVYPLLAVELLYRSDPAR